MKSILKFICTTALCVAVQVSAWAQATPWTGTGTENDPWQIATVDDLMALSTYVMNDPDVTYVLENTNTYGKYWKLMNNLDMSSVAANAYTPIGGWLNATTPCSPLKPFAGTFDGNNKKIKNFSCSKAANYVDGGVGVFGTITNATIKNLGVEGTVSGSGSNSYTQYIGGLVGYALTTTRLTPATITNCYFSGNVSGRTSSNNNYMGGLVGYSSAHITSCYTTGNVGAATLGYAGGLVGYRYSVGNISNCYSTAGGYCGFIGYSGGIELEGYEEYGNISNCYAAPTTIASGGSVFIHNNVSGKITNCYYSTRLVSPSVLVYRGTGTISPLDIIGKTDTQLKETAMAALLNSTQTPAAWLADYTPNINNGFPILSWQRPQFGAVTGEPNNYTPNSITLNGRVNEGDEEPVTETGFEWRVGSLGAFTAVPVSANAGVLTYQLNGLTPNTTYNARAYAKTATQTAYGETIEFELADWNGQGSDTSPYEIRTAQDMVLLSQYVMNNKSSVNKSWKMMNDIDMNAVSDFTPIGGWSNASTRSDDRRFSGIFDGNNYAVKNLTIARPSGYYVALFGNASGGGEIIRLGMVDCSISGTNYVGSIAAMSDYCAITDCYATGTTVTATNYGGGLVGYQSNADISGCYFVGTMECNAGLINANIGGLVGSLYNCTVSNSYARAAFNTSGGSSRAGGFVGTMTVGTVANCYTAVQTFNVDESVTAKNGLFAGEHNGGTITNCYYATTIAEYTGIGNKSDVAGLIVKTETEMQSADMVAHPGIENNSLNYGQSEPLAWVADPAQINNKYPVLFWQKDNVLTPTYTVNITTPTNGTITVMNGVEPVYNAAVLPKGATLILTATPAEDYEFEKWWDNNTDTERNIVLNDNIIISAVFKEKGSQTSLENIIAGNAIQIYPNPVKDKLTIKSGELLIKKLEITDLSGLTLISLPSPTSQINISNLPTGIYLIKITTENGVTVKKIVKE